METIRIFISSPGDVVDERDKARAVLDQLRERYHESVRLVPVLWEDLPLQVDGSFQEGIDLILSDRFRIDIAVFILWSRMGSALGSGVQRADGTAYRSGTEREFDLMLSAREASGGEHPQMIAYLRDDDEGFKSLLTEAQTDSLVELIDQRKQAEYFIRENFYDENGRNLRAIHSYREPIHFANRLRVHLSHLIDAKVGSRCGDGEVRWEGEPYRGLEVFDVEHAPVFFGREEEIIEIESRLRRSPAAVVVVGASGAGKSSLARAGVIANLQRFDLDQEIREWRHTILVPGTVAGGLFSGLASCLLEVLPELSTGGVELEPLAAGLRDHPTTAVHLALEPAFERLSRGGKGRARVVLLVDQLEELWTDGTITKDDREAFFKTLLALASVGPLAILTTLRSDFYPMAQQSPAFLALKKDGRHFDLPAPGAGDYARMIREPGRLAGVRFEEDPEKGKRLDEVILEEIARSPDALPLLQHALSELFARRTPEGLLTFAAYESIGGVVGAVGNRAEAVFHELPEAAQRVFGEVFHELVTVGESSESTALRRRAPQDRICDTEPKRVLVESLVKERLLATDALGKNAVVSISHEALLRQWERLAGWIERNRTALRLRARIEAGQARWERQGEDLSLLLPVGLPLEEGRELREHFTSLLGPETIDFIDRSTEFHDRQSVRKLRALWIVAGTMAMLAVVAGIAGWNAREASLEADRRTIEAMVAEKVAKASREIAEAKLADASESEFELKEYLLRDVYRRLTLLYFFDLGRGDDEKQHFLKSLINKDLDETAQKVGLGWITDLEALREQNETLRVKVGDESGEMEKYTWDEAFGKKHPELLHLVLTTESMEAEERRQWLGMMNEITAEQKLKLFSILLDERVKLDALDLRHASDVRELDAEHTRRTLTERVEEARKTYEMDPSEDNVLALVEANLMREKSSSEFDLMEASRLLESTRWSPVSVAKVNELKLVVSIWSNQTDGLGERIVQMSEITAFPSAYEDVASDFRDRYWSSDQAAEPAVSIEAADHALKLAIQYREKSPDGNQPMLSSNLYLRSYFAGAMGEGDRALHHAQEALRYGRETPSQHSRSLERASDLLSERGEYADALDLREERLALNLEHWTEEVERASEDRLTISWFALFLNRFDYAQEVAEDAIASDPAFPPIYTNLAHALLFQGKVEEAKKVYLGRVGSSVGDETWEAMILKDFGTLEKAGLTHPMIPEIQETLQQALEPSGEKEQTAP